MLVPANIFQPLIDVFEAVLKFFHNNAGVSWGWSIVLLTVVIRALLVPLTLKQFHSMQRLQRLQPELKAIQNKYKDDKQRQQQELMKFYKENQVNPLGSCLPLVAQLPVFISLFYMLRQDLRKNICPGVQHAYQMAHHVSASHTVPCGVGHGAGFLFINDLTNTAKGGTLVALIVLYVGTQLASSLMMSTPTMDKRQRQIMLLMPLFFVIFIINFPAGLIVYWITTNSWTILQQYIVRRRIGPVTPPAPAGATAGAGATAAAEPASNGADAGGIGGMLRGWLKPVREPAGVVAEERSRGPDRTGASAEGARGSAQRARGSPQRSRRSGPPPPPPRKKKKRSGRRR